jgi:pilus assembly protein CpaC
MVIILMVTTAPIDAKMRRRGKAKTHDVNLYVGLEEYVKLPYLPKNPKFEGDFKKYLKLSYSLPTETLRIYPKRVGNGTIIVVDPKQKDATVARYVFTVKNSKLTKVAREVKDLLKEIEGIRIRIINSKVVVDGEVLLPSDLNRIQAVIKEYGEQASSIVTLSPLAQKKFAELIERDINNPEIHVRAVNGKFILEGVANDKSEKERAEIIAKTYVPDSVVQAAVVDGKLKERKVNQIVINLLSIKPSPAPAPKKIIQIVVHYVELKKGYWSPLLPAPLVTSCPNSIGPKSTVMLEFCKAPV